MNLQQGQSILKWLGSRAIVVYGVIFLTSFCFVNYKGIAFKVKLRELNMYQPSDFKDMIYAQEGQPFDQNKIKESVLFYEKILEHFPGRADAHGALGFCYFYLGDLAQAKEHYKRAVDIEPAYFWYSYDLGMIYMREGRYVETQDFLEKAIAVSFESSLEHLQSSKIIYHSLLYDAPRYQLILEKRFHEAYRQAVLGLALLAYHLKDYSSMLEYAVYGLEKQLVKPEDFLYLGGVASFYLTDYSKAILFLQTCIDTNASYQDAYYYWGQSLIQLGKPDIAANILTKMSKSAPELPRIQTTVYVF